MFRTLTMLGLALASPLLDAGSFAVNPVRITLDRRDHPVAALTVRNNSDVATVVQADAMQWSALDGSDHYQASSALLVSPPLFTLPPRASQVVRVGLRHRQGNPEVAAEQSFRLYLSEVPPPPVPGFRGLNVALRLGVPVFVSMPGAAARLGLEVQPSAAGVLKLAARNSGTAHVRLNRLDIRDSQGGTLAGMALARDLLGGQQREFQLPMTLVPGAALNVRIDTSDGPQDFVLRLPPG